MKRLSRNIHTHTLLVSLVPALILGLLLISYLTYTRLQDLRTERHQVGQLIADVLAPATEFGVITGNSLILESLLQGSLDTPYLRAVEVYDHHDRLLALAGQPPAPHEQDVTQYVASIRRQPIPLNDPFLSFGRAESSQADERLGWVRVSMTDNPFSERQSQILLSAGLLLAFALSFTLFLAQRLARSLSQPIKKMDRAVLSIGQGRQVALLPEPAIRELGDLARHINQLAAALAAADRQQRISIRQLTQAREEAEAANRAKSDFLAMMSHELRTPMNGVLGMLQLLETTPLNPEQAEYTALANESTEHLLKIINDILDFSRIERGSLDFEQIPFNLAELLQNTVQAFQPGAQQRGLDLMFDAQPGLEGYEVHGDPTRVRQILVNLLGNALKFTEQGGVRLQVRWRRVDDAHLWVSCAVRDSGIGIDAERLANMFDPFQQADSSISRRYGGTGLGLSIARNLAEGMGGQLLAHSQPGHGSTFTLELTFECTLREASLPTGRPVETRLGGGQHILIVEDNVVNQIVTQAMLRSLGYRISQAHTGLEALRMAQNEPFDALLMDCQLPELDGLSVTRELRKLPGYADVPVIALTANALPGDREACLAAGMNDFLAKPFKRADLQRLLLRWLTERKESPDAEC
ncbi:MAG TPA: ATP-binding protein [Pseudomonas sp.]|nr:ATP-binding protein [Pseudomonas sp.]